ncbi:flagellar biosynthesis repressor FlbT [Methylobacterium sp. GXF4]|jgi:flagellar protein FlbT|uniref:flagellar biosynthesis repressor FlbT n=1 Tax=Methylobacterium sp. GXF4 TaxID=1096546 RepID=UPI0009D95610|nr:flagellar biosynthesis repressor FlbT [Methylobacterium sp. GXF4]
MGLRITLKPNERLIINGGAVRNGDRSTVLHFENHCKFLRGSEIILESEANTPCKQLCLLIQIIHLSENSPEMERLFFEKSVEILKYLPSAAPFLLDIQRFLSDNETHRAIKVGRDLLYHEVNIIERRASA